MPLDRVTALAFALRSSPSAYALLIGSGVSSAVGIPTGWDIGLELIRRIAAAQGADAGAAPEQWYVRELGEEPQYSTLLDRLGAGAQACERPRRRWSRAFGFGRDPRAVSTPRGLPSGPARAVAPNGTQ